MSVSKTDWRKCVISPELSFRKALAAIESSGLGVIVLEEAGKLVGLATDGDMRRWILNRGDLDAPMSLVATSKPRVVLETEQSPERLQTLMRDHRIMVIPVVDRHNNLISVVFWTDIFQPEEKLNEAIDAPVVVMAGGRGTRLDPLTRVLPKPLIPIGDKTIIERIMERFRECGCSDFYISVGFKAALIKAFFAEADFGAHISYLEETMPLGTAGSLAMLRGNVSKPFFVTNCDVLVEADFADALRQHIASNNAVTVFGALKNYRIPYGVLKTGSDGTLLGVEEKPGYDFLVNTGVYILNPQVLELVEPNQLCHMTDLVDRLIKNGFTVGVYPVPESAWMDMGQMAELKMMVDRMATED